MSDIFWSGFVFGAVVSGMFCGTYIAFLRYELNLAREKIARLSPVFFDAYTDINKLSNKTEPK